jgi:hypothetical protein
MLLLKCQQPWVIMRIGYPTGSTESGQIGLFWRAQDVTLRDFSWAL